jgi:hypothetical protein
MIGIHMTVQPYKLLQDGGAPEYMYHDRTAWHCAFFVAKKYGCSKGYPQRNAAHMGHMLSSGDSFLHLIQKRGSQLGFVTYLLNYPRTARQSH